MAEAGERRCAHCGVPIYECMGFILARDQMRLLDGERIMPRELCGKCILLWSTRFVDGEIVDTTQEERAAFIDALPAPTPPPPSASPRPCP